MLAPTGLEACLNGIASGCCGAYCVTSCPSGSCLVQRNGCSNFCQKCQVSTCQTTCPLNYYLQPDSSNVCIGTNPTCKKCTACPTCQTSCPAGYLTEEDTTNPCYATQKCKKCTPCTCVSTCPSNYYLQPDTTNVCYASNPTCGKCTACPNCATSCPAGSYSLGPDTSNPCNAQMGNTCLKCNTCSSAPGIPSPCNAKPATCRPGTRATVIFTGPSGCPQCWACR